MSRIKKDLYMSAFIFYGLTFIFSFNRQQAFSSSVSASNLVAKTKKIRSVFTFAYVRNAECELQMPNAS